MVRSAIQPWKALALGGFMAIGLALTLNCSGKSNPAPAPTPAPVTAPVITAQPLSNIVVQGAAVTLSVTAKGDGLAYQWSKGEFVLTGANATSYTFMATPESAGAYWVKITNSHGQARSEYATITVDLGYPVISGQPLSKTVEVGETATFKVLATAMSAMTYQWRKDDVDIPGATADTFVTGATILEDTGTTYSVKVVNAHGEALSKHATLSVSLLLNGTFEKTDVAKLLPTSWICEFPAGEGNGMILDYVAAKEVPPEASGNFGLVNGWWSHVATDAAYQTITIPVDAPAPQLLWVMGIGNWFASNPEAPVNFWWLKIRDEAGVELATLLALNDTNYLLTQSKDLQYVNRSVDLSAYKGQTIRICFESSQTDAAKDSIFVLDNVRLVTK